MHYNMTGQIDGQEISASAVLAARPVRAPQRRSPPRRGPPARWGRPASPRYRDRRRWASIQPWSIDKLLLKSVYLNFFEWSNFGSWYWVFDHFDFKDTPSKKKKPPTQKTLQIKVAVPCQEAAIQPVKLEFITLKIFFVFVLHFADYKFSSQWKLQAFNSTFNVFCTWCTLKMSYNKVWEFSWTTNFVVCDSVHFYDFSKYIPLLQIIIENSFE